MNTIKLETKSQILKLISNVQKIILKNIYSYDSDLKDEYFPNMGGFCLNASYLIFKTLKNNNYNPSIVINEEHSFVLCDGYLIDISAYQFNSKLENYPKINLMTYDYIYHKFNTPSFWKIDSKFNDLETCKEHCQTNMFYSDSSIPFYLKHCENETFNNIEYQTDKLKII